MEKIITDELITKKLEAEGLLEFHDMEENKAWSLLQAYYDCEVDDQWRNRGYDFYCYEETTADGYTVYITTSDPDSICISEDVHYYENDLSNEIETAIKDGCTMYIDDLDATYFMDAVEEAYGTMYANVKQKIENELIEEGYEYENRDETVTEMV
jgi:hypothetical protein